MKKVKCNYGWRCKSKTFCRHAKPHKWTNNCDADQYAPCGHNEKCVEIREKPIQMVWLKARYLNPKTKRMCTLRVGYEWDNIDISVKTNQCRDRNGFLYTAPTATETITISGKRRNFKEMELQ